MKRFLMTTAIALVPISFANIALADCDDLSPGNGDTVTCTATDVFDGPDAIETREIDDGSKNVTVNVEAGASIDTTASGEDAIKLKDTGSTINNSGTIAGGDEAIVGGDGMTVVNSGQISAVDQGIVGETENDADANSVTVKNSGKIQTSDRAINVGDGTGLSVENSAGGLIEAQDEGIQGGDNLSVDNAGTISAVEKAVDANGDNARITNAATGVIKSSANEAIETGDFAEITNHGEISGFDDAIQVGENAVIVNHGTIANTQTPADLAANPSLEAQDAIDIDSGEITNFGEIRSTTNSAIDFDPGAKSSQIENFGLISGTIAVNTDDADTQGQEIINAGALIGTSGTALYLGAGQDTLVSLAGSSIIGGADFGDDNDSMVFSYDFFDTSIGAFGDGGLFDGGDGEDSITFLGLLSSDVEVSMENGILLLTALGLSGDTTLRLVSWENFYFLDGALTYSQLTAVPLPAGALLFGSALAGLGLVSRRRSRKSATA
ncbi:VPLPA-CTERM sorting domain-containing protein [Roseibium aggregatum]|uniref:Secreted protein n=1 Tax=Roseibium aggregatum TaxID=187304 RepID=A0A939EC91_9HYPH|nr:VPLPA-CTERM sorting domain-containing protein [Roseibium aggregatum]MBN9670520.1 hypothetical protein [Roseibium aggregatum]